MTIDSCNCTYKMLHNYFYVQEKDDKSADDEEASPNVTPKWLAGNVTAIHLQTEEEEKAEEESQGKNLIKNNSTCH